MIARVRVGKENIDLVARKVLMSCLCYYGLDRPVVSDGQYDEWVERLADEWSELDRFRRWQFRSRDDVEVTGIDFRMTLAVHGGTVSWLQKSGLIDYSQEMVMVTRNWRTSKKWKLWYLYPDEFTVMSRDEALSKS